MILLFAPKVKLLETGTSNIIFIKNNKYFSPSKKFYRGVNLKVFEKKFKIRKTNIYIKTLNEYDEILLIGSGKRCIYCIFYKEKNWKRKIINHMKNSLKIKFEITKQKDIYIIIYERSK